MCVCDLLYHFSSSFCDPIFMPHLNCFFQVKKKHLELILALKSRSLCNVVV